MATSDVYQDKYFTMSFPTITFKHTNVSPDYALQDLVTRKLQALAKYLKGARDVRVEVEIERIQSHQHGPVCRMEVNVWRGDTLVRAEATEETFEKVVDTVRRRLEHELERSHEKRTNIMRRSARRLKELMRWRSA